MNHIFKKNIKLMSLSVFILLFQACGVKISVAEPKVSKIHYEGIQKTNSYTIQFESNLKKDYPVSTGRVGTISLSLEHHNNKINPQEFIELAIKKELKARNIALKIVNSSNNKMILKDFRIHTRRISGFSPFITISSLKLKININSKAKTFVSILRKAMVPMWSLQEATQPCYNEPTTLLVKEMVAKINKNYFGHKFSDKSIQELQDKITVNKGKKSTYLDVYELGFSNNLKTLAFLKELTTSKHEYIRLAAISSISTLGNAEEFDFLVSLNSYSKNWHDKMMALKSIGDLDTAEAHAYLKKKRNFWQGKKSKEAIWTLRMINLFLK